MKRKQVWRYYCEHCGKGGCAAGHMAKHERGCTRNPERDCRVCAKAGIKPVPLPDLLAIVNSAPIDEPYMESPMVARLTAATDCPVCAFAALRQAERHHDVDFQLQPRMRDFWATHNAHLASEYGTY